MIGVQLLALALALTALYLSFLYYKRKDFTKKELIFWAIIWFALIFVAFVPHSLDFFIKTFGFSRAMDLIFTFGFVILFFLSFHNYIIIHRIEKKIEKLVRDEALKDVKK